MFSEETVEVHEHWKKKWWIWEQSKPKDGVQRELEAKKQLSEFQEMKKLQLTKFETEKSMGTNGTDNIKAELLKCN